MKITRTVKKILDNYESDCPGTKANLARILMHGRLGGSGKMVILPVDQGFEHGPARSFAPNPDAYDPHYHYQLAIDAGLNAYAAPLGPLEAGADTFAGAIPTILKLNSANSLSTNKDQAVTASVDDALRLGCSAIGFTIYPGSEDQYEMMEEIRELRRGGEVGRPRRRHVVLSARRQARQGGRDRARRLRLRRPHRGPARRPHHQGQAADRRAVAARGQGRLREGQCRHLDPGGAHQARHAGDLQRPAHRRVLRRRGQGPRRPVHRDPRPARRRRQRLDHRPQHLPAPARPRRSTCSTRSSASIRARCSALRFPGSKVLLGNLLRYPSAF